MARAVSQALLYGRCATYASIAAPNAFWNQTVPSRVERMAFSFK
jgi:hypothetical protein